MDRHDFLGIHVTNRMQHAVEMQKLFSEYGCYIKTRLGLHDVGADHCASTGVVLLELFGDRIHCDELETKLGQIPGVEVQRMVFTHP